MKKCKGCRPYQRKTYEEWVDDICDNGYEHIWSIQKTNKAGETVIMNSNLCACLILDGQDKMVEKLRDRFPCISASGFTVSMLMYWKCNVLKDTFFSQCKLENDRTEPKYMAWIIYKSNPNIETKSFPDINFAKKFKNHFCTE